MKKNDRTVLICAGAAALVTACALGLLQLNRPAPPAPQATAPQETVEYLASEQFGKADQGQKQEYVRQMRVRDSNTPILSLLFNPRVSEQQRRKVMENILPVVGPVIEQRLNEFQQLSAQEQTARLDGIIDQIQAFRKSHPEMAPSAERLNMILQFVDPYMRAKLRERLPALQERMKQRGIAPTPLM